MPKKDKKKKESEASYRFKVGDNILCRTCNGWEPGKIVKLNYSNPGETEIHPYQVKMKRGGRLIFVPIDDDVCCQRHVKAWWEDLLEREDLSDEEGIRLMEKLSKGGDINAKSFWGDAAIHECMRCNWEPGVETLLNLRADPNLAGEKHERPLNMAVLRSAELVSMLLDAKADPSLQDEDPEKNPDYESKSFKERQWHRSALHYAVMKHSLELTKVFIEKRADINQLDAQYKQPLHLAIDEQVPDIVDLLLAAKADVNTGNMQLGLNSYPLVDAAYRGDLKLTEKLIDAKSDINRQGKQGMTPLHMAARGKRSEVIQFLVEAKADISIKAGNGKTAGELALANGSKESACLLGHVADEVEGQNKIKSVDTKISELDPELLKQLYID